MQKYSSKNTSVNTTKLAKIWHHIVWDCFDIPCNIIDYGCGRNPSLAKRLCEQQILGCNYYPYDPYWITRTENLKASSTLTLWKDCDLLICANVLNVIENNAAIERIISEIVQAKSWAIQIYEGNKSGIGAVTKKDCYQRNQKIIDYLQYFPEEWQSKIFIYKGFITNNKNIIK